MQDKFNTREKKSYNLKYFWPEYDFDEKKVTSVWVVIFTPERKIVLTELKRGIDIPGWHVQITDKTFEDAVKREAYEETKVRIKNLQLCTVVESDYFWSAQDELTYMIFYVAEVDELFEFLPDDESFARHILSVEEFLENYSWNKELIEKVVYGAEKIFLN